MSMLAEKRRKENWVLNPRSTAWTEDSNKFGQRMLQKMGWKPGKGLGVNEQGIVNALRIKYKSDLRGLGCDRKQEDWTKTQEEFNTLLGELAGEDKDSGIGKQSLEQTSKTIRSRVHYHKFTRGKDLARYSAKDLECILGFNNVTNSKNSSEKKPLQTEFENCLRTNNLYTAIDNLKDKELTVEKDENNCNNIEDDTNLKDGVRSIEEGEENNCNNIEDDTNLKDGEGEENNCNNCEDDTDRGRRKKKKVRKFSSEVDERSVKELKDICVEEEVGSWQGLASLKKRKKKNK